MSLAASDIIANAGDLLDDVTIPDPTTTALRFLNEARRHLATETNCIWDTASASSVAYQTKYSVNNNVIGIRSVRYHYALNSYCDLGVKTLKEYEAEQFTGTQSQYGIYSFDGVDRYLNVSPPVADSADTTTLATTVNSSITTFVLTDSSEFAMSGRGIMGTEVFYWQYNDTANDTLRGVVRGAEGTTAASHTAGDTFTERDIVYNFYKLPADLTYGNYVEQIFEMYPHALAYYICMKAKMKDTDDTNPGGGMALENLWSNKFEQEKANILFQLNRVYNGPRTVKEV